MFEIDYERAWGVLNQIFLNGDTLKITSANMKLHKQCPNSPANILNLDELFIPSDGAVELDKVLESPVILGLPDTRKKKEHDYL